MPKSILNAPNGLRMLAGFIDMVDASTAAVTGFTPPNDIQQNLLSWASTLEEYFRMANNPNALIAIEARLNGKQALENHRESQPQRTS